MQYLFFILDGVEEIFVLKYKAFHISSVFSPENRGSNLSTSPSNRSFAAILSLLSTGAGLLLDQSVVLRLLETVVRSSIPSCSERLFSIGDPCHSFSYF